MSRAALLGWLVTTMVVVACSGQTSQSPAGAEYVLEVERLLTTMQATIAARVADTQSQPPSIEAVRALIDGELVALDDFLSGFRGLEPPVIFAEDHARAAVAVQDLRDGTETLAKVARSVNTLPEFEMASQGAPIEALEEASERAWEMCRRAQDTFSDGVERALEFTSPWMQASASEHVDIDLKCFIG